MDKPLVIFDFDGVIVNTLDFSFEINRSFNPDLKREDWVDLHSGDSFYDEYKNPKRKIRNTVADFYKVYEKKIYKVLPYKGIPDVLEEIGQDYNLSIVSGSPERIIKRYLEKFGLEGFDTILGTETHLDKTHKLNLLLKTRSVNPKDCILITDTICDIREGQKVGVQSIAVTWGMFDQVRFSPEKPFDIVGNPSEIPASIQKYFAALKKPNDYC
jgi:phosphoglycolate phosphatase-like HAD superfamily hydrolase